jgi:hypothetical protein
VLCLFLFVVYLCSVSCVQYCPSLWIFHYWLPLWFTLLPESLDFPLLVATLVYSIARVSRFSIIGCHFGLLYCPSLWIFHYWLPLWFTLSIFTYVSVISSNSAVANFIVLWITCSHLCTRQHRQRTTVTIISKH